MSCEIHFIAWRLSSRPWWGSGYGEARLVCVAGCNDEDARLTGDHLCPTFLAALYILARSFTFFKLLFSLRSCPKFCVIHKAGLNTSPASRSV